MATITVLLEQGKKETIKVTPSTVLSQVVQQVCQKHSLSTEKYSLVLAGNDKEVDTSLTYRLSGIAAGQKLKLKRKANGGQGTFERNRIVIRITVIITIPIIYIILR